MTVAWVVGGSGLLGSAVCRQLRGQGTSVFAPAPRLDWSSPDELSQQVKLAVGAFSATVATHSRWEIYWTAGLGTMSSTALDLAAETQTLSLILDLLQSDKVLMATPGAFAFASSAGAIYAGARAESVDELTPIAPTTDYAREKLKQEALVHAFVKGASQRYGLIARISTIYGIGQSSGKSQGLIAHIARCVARNRPVQIYVPLDTIRDYIWVDDAAAVLVADLRLSCTPGNALVKIVASELPTSIAEIVGTFKRLTRRTPRIVTSASKLTALYARRVQFRSIWRTQLPLGASTSLLIGTAQLLSFERAAYARGSTATSK